MGLIDLHTHGIGRYDTRTDKPEDILKMAQLHAKAGTSIILPTIYSSTIEQMQKNMEAVRKAMEIQKFSLLTSHFSLILGIHLEGPFLNPIRCGAQDKNSFIKPTISNLKKLIKDYEDIVKIITIAPELPGALKVIEECASLGIKVNMGHSDATYKQALNGKKAGASGISHIFNAMRPFHHREPGLAGLGLMDKDLYIEVIADNIHLSRMALELIFKVKHPDRIILISDSVKAGKGILPAKGAGLKEKPVYSKKGLLAGSSITLVNAVRNLKNIGIPEKAIIKATVDNPKARLAS